MDRARLAVPLTAADCGLTFTRQLLEGYRSSHRTLIKNVNKRMSQKFKTIPLKINMTRLKSVGTQVALSSVFKRKFFFEVLGNSVWIRLPPKETRTG